MLVSGGDGHITGADGWTLHSVDGSRAAHIERTIAVTEEGLRILTLPGPRPEPALNQP
jgi:methionyl aminopeptidase